MVAGSVHGEARIARGASDGEGGDGRPEGSPHQVGKVVPTLFLEELTSSYLWFYNKDSAAQQ